VVAGEGPTIAENLRDWGEVLLLLRLAGELANCRTYELANYPLVTYHTIWTPWRRRHSLGLIRVERILVGCVFDVSRSRSGTTYQRVVSGHLLDFTTEIAAFPSRVFTRRKEYSV
jgi:hypothetical protein